MGQDPKTASQSAQRLWNLTFREDSGIEPSDRVFKNAGVVLVWWMNYSDIYVYIHVQFMIRSRTCNAFHLYKCVVVCLFILLYVRAIDSVQNSPLMSVVHMFDSQLPWASGGRSAGSASSAHRSSKNSKKRYRRSEEKSNKKKTNKTWSKKMSIFVNVAQPDISFPRVLYFWVVKICQNLFQAATWQQCEDFVLRMLSILIQPNNTMPEG